MDAVVLTTDRLMLDQPTDADVPTITRFCQDPLFEEYLTLPWPYRERDAEFFVRDFVPRGWRRGEEAAWAIRHDGAFVGVISFRFVGGDLGFWLGAEHRGHGLLPEAAGAVIDWLFENGRDSVEWECVVGNRASMRVAQKLGMRYLGEGPSRAPGRGGAPVASWRAELRRGDDRAPTSGWPETAPERE